MVTIGKCNWQCCKPKPPASTPTSSKYIPLFGSHPRLRQQLFTPSPRSNHFRSFRETSRTCALFIDDYVARSMVLQEKLTHSHANYDVRAATTTKGQAAGSRMLRSADQGNLWMRLKPKPDHQRVSEWVWKALTGFLLWKASEKRFSRAHAMGSSSFLFLVVFFASSKKSGWKFFLDALYPGNKINDTRRSFERRILIAFYASDGLWMLARKYNGNIRNGSGNRVPTKGG